MDHKQRIIDHMVTNRLSTTTDVNWEELSSLPEFEVRNSLDLLSRNISSAGTTQHYLERTY